MRASGLGASVAILTAAEVRAVALPALTGTTEDTLLGTLIDRADVAIARHLRWPTPASGTPTLEAASYVLLPERVDYLDPTLLSAGMRPIISITSIAVDDGTGAYGTTLAASAYALRTSAGRIKRIDGDPWIVDYLAAGWYKVTVSAGFSTIPADIKQAACLLVAHWYRQLFPDGGSTSDAGIGSVGFRGGVIPPPVVEMLAPNMLADL
jgi:hypothetical protein